MAWLYQDRWVKGKTIQKGQRECEGRYEEIKKVCAQFTRPFSVLDLGANAGYFSFRLATDFPNATVVMVEGNDSEAGLLNLCVQNNLPNIVYLNKTLSLEEVKTLSTCEYFDVVLALSVIHHFGDGLNTVLDTLVTLGSNLILEIPLPGEHALNQEMINKETIDVNRYKPTLLMQTKSCVGEVARPTYLIKKPKEKLTQSYLTGGRKGSYSEVQYSLSELKIHFPRKNQTHNFIPGINFYTFVMYNGVYPLRETVTSQLKSMPVEGHEDIRPYNLVVTTGGIVPIDAKDDMSWEKTPPEEHRNRIVRLWEERDTSRLTNFEYWQDVIFHRVPGENLYKEL